MCFMYLIHSPLLSNLSVLAISMVVRLEPDAHPPLMLLLRKTRVSLEV